MQRTSPRTLTDEEFIRLCANEIDPDGLPYEYQLEMLRRLTKYAPNYETHAGDNPNQLELPLQ